MDRAVGDHSGHAWVGVQGTTAADDRVALEPLMAALETNPTRACCALACAWATAAGWPQSPSAHDVAPGSAWRLAGAGCDTQATKDPATATTTRDDAAWREKAMWRAGRGCWCYRIDATLPRKEADSPPRSIEIGLRDVVDRARRRRRRRRSAERRRHYWMPVRRRASCRSWQARRATIRPSRTVNTS